MRMDPSNFYSPADGLPIGVGIILRDCPIPMQDDLTKKFLTALGPVLMLTHECDIDQDNDRGFNEHALVIPILPLDIWVDQMDVEQGVGSWGGILPKIAANEVFRALYLPPAPGFINVPELKFGGLLNLNTISSTPLEWHDHYKTLPICSLTAFGLRVLDYKLTNHLLRPKAASLWGSR